MNDHCNHLALKVFVCVKERQDRLPTMYWLPKLHKKTYKARFIANSSSCTTTELSKLLTSCLTAVKNHVIRYCEKVYERSDKNLFWSIKNSVEVLNKIKSRGFSATSLSTYDFSTVYTTLPHKLIKEKLINLIEWTFKREGSPYIACNERPLNLLSASSVNLHGLADTSIFHNNLRVMLSPLKSPVLRKYSNPFKRPGMYPSISKCNAKRCNSCMHLCTNYTVTSSVNGRKFSVVNNSDLD